MKFVIALLLFLTTTIAAADEVKVELNPAKPVAGEVFQAYFRIFTDSDEEPAVNFSPGNVEVVGKSNQGLSTRTVYANGRLTVTRERTVVYELVAAKAGTAYLRDITVQLGSRMLRHPSVSVSVLSEPQAAGDVFVMADVPKKNLYLGEGVVVRYYLYSKVPVSNLDIKKYPKLDKFLKRFLQEPERTERVSVDGQLYMRSQIYAAKLYPEKVGELRIDPLQLSATYPNTSPGDPFGAFGFSRDFKTKTLNSETVKLQVRPLPEPVPPHFTGLVGAHDFDLQVGQERLIVNEPLEVKLTVSGVGALENLEAPDLLKHPGLEEFESNGDLKITDANSATKTFDYTFLAKENLTLPAKSITLSYFDPMTERYVPTELAVPEIVVAGGAAGGGNKAAPADAPRDVEPRRDRTAEVVRELSGPLTAVDGQWRKWLSVVNLSLAGLAVVLSLGWVVRLKTLRLDFSRGDVPATFRKGRFEFGEFVKWLGPVITRTGKSPAVIIREAPLPEESKRYFIDLLAANDYKEYSSRKTPMEFKYRPAPFKDLGRYIESVKHESPSQPA
jgi:hypothetical protein